MGSNIYLVATPVVCVFGIAGIILTVVVLSRKTMRTSTNCYLIALSLADLFYLTLLALMLTNGSTTSESANGGDIPHLLVMIYNTYASILMQVLLMTSVWLTVILAVERYVAICRPFAAVRLCTVTKARLVIGTVFLAALGARLPNFWETRLVSHRDPATNTTVYYMESTDLCENELYTTVYAILVDALLVSVVPFVLLVVMNALLISQVRKSTRYLTRGSRGSAGCSVAQKEELQVTVMLISVVVVFFVCTAPYLCYTAVNSVNSFGSSPGIRLLRYVTILLLTLKSAVNFIVYCWFSEKFWATLKAILRLNRCVGRGAGKSRDDTETCSFRLVSRQ